MSTAIYNFNLTPDMIAGNTDPKRTHQEVAERVAWHKRFDEKWAWLDEVEPLPDNFEDLCKGRTDTPVWLK